MTHEDCAYYRLEWDHCWQRVAALWDDRELWRCAVCHCRLLVRYDEWMTDECDDELTAGYEILQGPEIPRAGIDVKPTFEMWAFEQEMENLDDDGEQ